MRGQITPGFLDTLAIWTVAAVATPSMAGGVGGRVRVSEVGGRWGKHEATVLGDCLAVPLPNPYSKFQPPSCAHQ